MNVIDLNKKGTSKVDLSDLTDGQFVKLERRTYRYIGHNDKESFWISNRKNAKYTCYAWIRDGVVDLYDLTQMYCTEAQLRAGHKFQDCWGKMTGLVG